MKGDKDDGAPTDMFTLKLALMSEDLPDSGYDETLAISSRTCQIAWTHLAHSDNPKNL